MNARQTDYGESYSGTENLKIMEEAHNYNNYLQKAVVAASEGSTAALDFGAGLGAFALELQRHGLRVTCIETDPYLRTRLRNQGFQAYESLENIPPDSLAYIYSLNVLEHIDNDYEVLADILQRLEPGGKVLLYVPAFQVLFSSVDKKVGHKRRYRKSALVNMLKLVGYTVDKATYVDSLGFVAALLFKAIGNKDGRLNPMSVRFFDKCVFPLSITLDHLVRHVAGKNLLVLAHRPLK